MGSCGSTEASNAVGPDGKPLKKRKETYQLQVCSHNLDEAIGTPVVASSRKGINCMAVSDDGSMIATGSDDCSVKVWSAKTERTECISNLQGHADYINVILFQDEFVVSASADKTIRKWDVLNRECVMICEGHSSIVNRILCTGDLVFSSSYDKTARPTIAYLRCWDFETGSCIRVFSGHKRGVYPMIFIPDFMPSAEDEDIAATNKNYSIDGNRDLLITGSADFTCRVWSFDTGKLVQNLIGHEGAITCLTVDESAKILYSGATDNTIRSWNIIRGEELKVFQGHTGSVVCITVKNKILYSGSSDFTARAWVTEFAECTRMYREHKHSVTCIKVIGGMVYTGCGDGMARIFDAKGGALKRTFQGHERSVTCLQVVELEVEEPDDELDDPKANVYTDEGLEKVVYVKLFTGSFDGTLRVWDAGGIADETVFSKDDEEKKQKEKERLKRKKKRDKEAQRAIKRAQKAEMLDRGDADIMISDETQYTMAEQQYSEQRKNKQIRPSSGVVVAPQKNGAAQNGYSNRKKQNIVNDFMQNDITMETEDQILFSRDDEHNNIDLNDYDAADPYTSMFQARSDSRGQGVYQNGYIGDI